MSGTVRKMAFYDFFPQRSAPSKTRGQHVLRAATHRPAESFRVKVVACMAFSDASQGCDLVKMLSLMRRFTRESDARRSLHRRRPAHVALLLAWLAFWLNTAFFPCCEALAAAFDDHTAGVSQSAPAATQAHHADPTHTERARDGHKSRCDFSLDAEPAINGEYAGLPKARLNLEWAASDVSFSVGPTAVNQTANFTPRDDHPPPIATVRLYLRTQRLLI